ncbi:hypothetical protein BOTBODRAFT_63785 [Botryobasidium botryosum FD-172 SS1]|uniref:GED domain-containing protein n=1 Tax=Botryobasidium botryosum (strain FD-172 SS1) TaxID=930990 RepID=A0A067MQP4_BOTB1|nr:hypothetical protein BOTBODRAFT_63785 [Botryobasidium botryosum FD-172 SS1]
MASRLETLSTSNYAARRKELMQLTKRLRGVGAQADVDLPRIAVIGNQSAGKSSLVEAISGITVPRDSGTCTRCPMECRLSASTEPWYCQVSLRFEYDEYRKPLKDVREVAFGPSLSFNEKADVELVLRRAQTAILNPNIPHTDFLSLSVDELRNYRQDSTLKFSRNVVCLDISGPNLTDLSFVDLPGIIQNDEPEIVQLVEDLVVSHIRGNCLIMIALPMTDDIENQRAARLAKQEDETGQRTIGVLTKPDYLTSGSTKRRQEWLDVVEGRSAHKLRHGYFVTRQPDDDERAQGITAERARQVEMEFFNTQTPWNNSTEPRRFGTVNLTDSLSKLLTDIINKSLPGLRSEVQSSLDKCRETLAKLPRPIEDPSSEVLHLIAEFSSELKAYVNGLPGHEKLVQKNRLTHEKFKADIRRTVPRFIPFEDASQNDFDETCDDEDASVDSDDCECQPMYLNDMRAHIKATITWELPGNVPYHAKAALIANITKMWNNPAHHCFNAVAGALEKLLRKMIDHKFNRFAALQAQMTVLVSEVVKQQQVAALATLGLILQFEGPPLYTQNTHYNSAVRERWLTKYKHARRPKDSPLPSKVPSQGGPGWVTPLSEAVQEALASLTRAGFSVKEEDLVRLEPVDEYEEELGVMADVRAYFQVAYKRVIDYIPLTIEHTFVRAIANGMQESLIKGLKLGEDDSKQRCAMFLNEDENIILQREDLEAKQHRLEQAHQELLNFGGL